MSKPWIIRRGHISQGNEEGLPHPCETGIMIIDDRLSDESGHAATLIMMVDGQQFYCANCCWYCCRLLVVIDPASNGPHRFRKMGLNGNTLIAIRSHRCHPFVICWATAIITSSIYVPQTAAKSMSKMQVFRRIRWISVGALGDAGWVNEHQRDFANFCSKGVCAKTNDTGDRIGEISGELFIEPVTVSLRKK